MYRTFLSWRYLKSRRTNLIGIVGIFIGVGALILILSIMTGFLEESRKSLRGSLSDLIVTLYIGQQGTATPAPGGPEQLLAAIENYEVRPDSGEPYKPVEAASAHLVWYGLVLRDAGLYSDTQFSQRNGVKLVGIDVEREFRATGLYEALVRDPIMGSLVADPEDPFAMPPGAPTRGRPRPRVVIGEQLFRTHGLFRGQVINLATVVPTPGGDPNINNREVIVAGTFRSRDNEMDLERVYMEREELARFLAAVPPGDDLPPDALRYTEILVKLHDYERDRNLLPLALATEMVERGLLHPYSEVHTWEDFRRELLGAIQNERSLMAIMLSLVLIVASFTIFAILSMMVTEKRRDIGILTALGATPQGVMVMFLLIGFWDALLGATLGAIAGTWMALEIDSIELWLSKQLDIEIFDRSVYLFDHIPSVVEPLWVACIVLGAFVFALMFAAIPAWSAAKLDPLEALRYE